MDVAPCWFPRISDSQRWSILCYLDKYWLDDNLGGRLSREKALMMVLIAIMVDLVSRSIPFSDTP